MQELWLLAEATPIDMVALVQQLRLLQSCVCIVSKTPSSARLSESMFWTRQLLHGAAVCRNYNHPHSQTCDACLSRSTQILGLPVQAAIRMDLPQHQLKFVAAT